MKKKPKCADYENTVNLIMVDRLAFLPVTKGKIQNGWNCKFCIFIAFSFELVEQNLNSENVTLPF